MGQHQTAVVVDDVLAYIVGLDLLAVGHFQLHIRALGIQKIHGEIVQPAVLLKGLHMIFRGVALALIGGIGLHDGAAYPFHHRLPEVGAQKILVAGFTGMDFNGYIAGQRNA